MYYLNFNNVQNVFKKAIESGMDILHKRFYKMAGNQIAGLNGDLSIQLPLGGSNEYNAQFEDLQPSNHRDEESSDFQNTLDQLDAKAYATFMMHLEGYRTSEIASYLEQTESEVILQIAESRNALKINSKAAVN
ncbi:hypothetical protein ACFSQ3_07640 [Sphingobacterium corticis]|uniref:RNA polymerase sigma factor 70 region 4 type 2 domain-containing protein n=1 Tax=Sphingobacterium corticis TaxID=1812823 RepID=A0ABW5NLU3_9SPHI